MANNPRFFSNWTSFYNYNYDLYLWNNTQTGTSYTALASDLGSLTTLNNASPVSVTLPSPSNVDPVSGYTTSGPAVFCKGWWAKYKNKGAGLVTFNTGLTITLATNEWVEVRCTGTAYEYIKGGSSGTGGVTTLNSQSGACSLTSSGSTVTITNPSAGVINLESAGGGGVSSLNSLTGACSITAGTGISVTPSGSNIIVTNTGGGGGGGPLAWVNFNGTGTPSIRASSNVTSITKNATGDYTINFTSALPSANYAGLVTAGNSANDIFCSAPYTSAPTTTAFRLITLLGNRTPTDCAYVNAVFFG